MTQQECQSLLIQKRPSPLNGDENYLFRVPSRLSVSLEQLLSPRAEQRTMADHGVTTIRRTTGTVVSRTTDVGEPSVSSRGWRRWRGGRGDV